MIGKTNIWMPLYVGDYISATRRLTTVQHGAYMLLLMEYWQTGEPLPDDAAILGRISGLTPSEWQTHATAIGRYFTVSNGVWLHDRVEVELKKARANQEKKSDAGKTGAYARWGGKSNGKRNADANADAIARALAEGMPPQCPSPSPIAERACAERPSLDEVKAHAQTIGLAEWKAADWFDEMEGGGWLDHNKRPVGVWQAILRRVRTKWEADGRPMSPPTNYKAGVKTFPPSLSQQIASTVARIAEIDRNLAKIGNPNREVMPLEYDAAKKLRTPLVEEKSKLRDRLTQLHAQQSEGGKV